MITEREVKKAIDECMQEPITGAKRTALADLIIIQDYLFGAPRQEVEYAEIPSLQYSEQAVNEICTGGGSEFLDAVDGKKPEKVWKVLNELVEATKVLHPQMYRSLIEKIYDL